MVAFLGNAAGIRDEIIQGWVNTTSPWFNEPGIFHQDFNSAVAALPHTLIKLAEFSGKAPVAFPGRVRALKSPSGAVLRGRGAGAGGYLEVMDERLSHEVLGVARRMEVEWRERWEGPCVERDVERDLGRDGEVLWVGGDRRYDVSVPAVDCPVVFTDSRIVQATLNVSNTTASVR